jgi:hypothetical protein
LYSNNSYIILNISIMARFKLVGKKRTKKMAPAKQGRTICPAVIRLLPVLLVLLLVPLLALLHLSLLLPMILLSCSLALWEPKLYLACPSPLLLLPPLLLVLPPPHLWLVPICLILPPPLDLKLPVSLRPKGVHRRPRNMQKDLFHLLLKQQPSPLLLPLLLSTLVTLHPSLLMLLPL